MTPQEVLQAFHTARAPPVDAMRAALANREEMLPAFHQELTRAAEMPWDLLPYYDAYGIMFEILAEWADARSYGPVVAFLRLEWHRLEDLLGDSLTETGIRILARVATEDLTPLRDLVLDTEAYVFARSQAITALIGIAAAQPARRADVIAHIREIGAKLGPEEDEIVIAEWAAAVALFSIEDQVPQARAACNAIPRSISPLVPEEFEQFLGLDIDRLSESRLGRSYVIPPAVDAIAKVSLWDWASGDDVAVDGAALDEIVMDTAPKPDNTHLLSRFDSMLNPYRHVGRNDPCPCGSGKKFKKCCLT